MTIFQNLIYFKILSPQGHEMLRKDLNKTQQKLNGSIDIKQLSARRIIQYVEI